jgi:hypothetical protein
MPKLIRVDEVWETLYLEINVNQRSLTIKEEKTEEAIERRAENISDLS